MDRPQRRTAPHTACHPARLDRSVIKDSEKKAREDKAAADAKKSLFGASRSASKASKREQQRIDKKAERKSKEKQKAFERLISLPSEQHETRLAELAKRFDEDVAAIRDDFTVFVGMESRAASTDPWNVEPWPDPVETLRSFRRSALRLASTSSCALKR